MSGVDLRRVISFRDSAITFAFTTALVAVLAVGVLVMLDPRSQAFWGAKLDAVGTAVRALLDQLGWFR